MSTGNTVVVVVVVVVVPSGRPKNRPPISSQLSHFKVKLEIKFKVHFEA